MEQEEEQEEVQEQNGPPAADTPPCGSAVVLKSGSRGSGPELGV